ncbi:fungal-specific transcription factor domain-containing protein [Bombardia bombarda]|uniref:Fungal-specific transcription factor domain-containing protein n=1 Tax=Bombardia bombarda TaxID=252184 RepID=A0AA40C9N8_9PEZI|nr:fungal-specific transcription factor domain-containing protein [Bombardia bombarda]
MTTRTRSSGGCWTCRLRRKKCDELHPLCGGCAALEIDCLYGKEKPPWMDGAQKQKDKAEWLKREIKRRAGTRRERRYLQGVEADMEGLDVSPTLPEDTAAGNVASGPLPAPSTSTSTSTSSSSPAGRESSLPDSGDRHTTPSSSTTLFGVGLTPASSDETRTNIGNPPLIGPGVIWSELTEHDVNLVMLYLDFVFPFLFPFYRPPLLHAGRGWLLAVLARNKALLHTSMSVASYFFNVVFSNTLEAGQLCRVHNFEHMQRQQNLALQELQREMQDIVARGVKGYLTETGRVLASIVQLLTFEVGIANTGSWLMHLDGATTLYAEIFAQHGMTDQNEPCFTKVLEQLGSKPSVLPAHNCIWSSDQASLRFFTAYLLFFDTLASTTLQQPPRLQRLHQHLLGVPTESEGSGASEDADGYTLPHIDLQEFIGLRNWVVISIGEIAALDAWKKEMKRTGALSMTQLVERAATIEQKLRRSMLTIDPLTVKPPCPPSRNPLNPLIQYTHWSTLLPSMMTEAINGSTALWGQAALTYLNVVVSGWQPANLEIRTSVAMTVSILENLPAPSCLRTAVWPFTITGCLAAPEQEDSFRNLVTTMGSLQAFGTIMESLAVMEKVWANRAQIEENADQWDVSACFRSLGHDSFLV